MLKGLKSRSNDMSATRAQHVLKRKHLNDVPTERRANHSKGQRLEVSVRYRTRYRWIKESGLADDLIQATETSLST